MRTDKRKQLSQEQLLEVIHATSIVGNLILFEFSRLALDARGKIIRNFIARSNLALKSIQALWKIGAYQDCWVIHRCIAERLFHLHDLVRLQNFKEFEDWSLVLQYEQGHSMQSDPEFRQYLSDEWNEHQNKLRADYLSLKTHPIEYKRPRCKEVARDMDLMFLYKYGYDFASTQIHPMANDGEEAFLLQIGDLVHPRHMDHRSVLVNSCLVHVLLIQEGLMASKRKWVNLIGNILEEVVAYLGSGIETYKIAFLRLRELGPGTHLSSQ